MNKIAIAASVLALAATCAAAGPFDAFKGKMKPGLYEMKMDMDMSGNPNIPPQYAKHSTTIQHCVTEQDLENGAFSRGRDGKGPDPQCEIKDMKMSGNSASYAMVCPKMTGDAKITFIGGGYVMDMNMTMDQGGRPMTVKQHMESKLVGPCSK
jgi:Protein of unknown function (DUF3617)